LAHAGYEPIIIDDFSNSDESVLSGLETLLGQKPRVHRFDCSDRVQLAQVFNDEKPSGVIHFAAFKAVGESVKEPLRYYRNNLTTLLSVLETMNEFGCTNFVFSSSCTVYGQPESNPVTEKTPCLPASSPYGRSKQMGEDIIHDHCRAAATFGAALLRYFNPIGAHSSGLIGELPFGVPNNLIPYLTQTAAGLRKELVVFGSDYETRDGSCIRDFIHVVDLAKAHVKALRWLENSGPGCDVFNLGQGKGNSVLEVIRTFERVAGVSVPHRIGPRRLGDVEKIWADVSKATRDLEWHTELTLADALVDAWRWQKELQRREFFEV